MFTRSALTGAALTTFCGLLLWGTELGVAWENASYDCLYRFGTRAPGNAVVQLRMDVSGERNLERIEQERRQHADLLDKLHADGARLVVFDVHFAATTSTETDARLAAAMRANGRVVLMADITNQPNVSDVDNVSLYPPQKIFLDAAGNYGVGRVELPEGQLVRRHWPGLSLSHGETNFHSLGWAAAAACGAKLDASAKNQWLRYYGKSGPGDWLPYVDAFSQTNGHFRDKVVFIGSWPQSPDKPTKSEADKFSTPYTLQGGLAVGGMEINATTFLNLLKNEWLRRLPAWGEFLLLVGTGILIGGGLRLLKPLAALLVAVAIFFAVMCAFVALSFHTNYWFPWLVIAGGQLPFALVWAWTTTPRHVMLTYERFPGYTPIGAPIGNGAYGQVWRVCNNTGEFQALKEIQLAKFDDADPYEREFRGIKSYKPISNQHPGLLHVDYVYRAEHGSYFFYVMELGDALDPGWEANGGKYEPRDLGRAGAQMEGRKMPARECIRIGIKLLEALDFLHQHGRIHRDIKPANIIFVNGQPKLADVGLIRETPTPGQQATRVYTPGFDDPLGLGTKLADMYALAITLYTSSTGNKEGSFPQLPTLVSQEQEFMRLNEIILRACQPVATARYASAAEMLAAFRAVQAELDAGQTQQM